MSLLTKLHYQLILLGNIKTGPWKKSGRKLPGQMNHDFSFITSMLVRNHHFPDEQLFSSCTADHIQVVGGSIMLLEHSHGWRRNL
ncbi:hypothetical protein TNCV_2188571 [Trichonephila clavipes]|nr:hypothetical protein TNCV_2188571 [Trichonephila clavipes]